MFNYRSYIQKIHNQNNNDTDLTIGQSFIDKKSPWISGRITRIIPHLGKEHYEILVKNRGAAPRIIQLTKEGLIKKFTS